MNGRKWLAIILVCVICFSLSIGAYAEDVQTEVADEEQELVELRQGNMKFYELPDGSRKCIVYSENVHF